ncbi:MAG: hypothetical protein M1832_002923 [Thelocarpon impressellum]|nr:MAG: hypothetical protein M1832_002923 [Thelocarpon impressellum]
MDDHADEDEDEPVTLSAAAAEALKEFYQEEDSRQKQFEDLKAQVDDEVKQQDLTIEAFAEDWNASQFWYDDETATTLAKQLLKDATSDSRVAVVSAPSVFVKVKQILALRDKSSRPQVSLFEFDKRFEVFSEFVPYDFQHPVRLPPEMKGAFDRTICDPPFLSTDCQTKGEKFRAHGKMDE